MAAYKEKGLCYNCDEVYAPGHRCKNMTLYMVMTEDEEAKFNMVTVEDATSSDEGCHNMEEVLVALGFTFGNRGITTLRLVGKVGHKNINILVDTESTFSFINEETAKALKCKIVPDNPIKVKVANGNRMVSTQKVRMFQWKMQQHPFTFAPRLLNTVGSDLILGGDWLRTHSPIELNYEIMTITLTKGDKRVALQAITKDELCSFITRESPSIASGGLL